jgi:Domain of unknown function (DUF1998)
VIASAPDGPVAGILVKVLAKRFGVTLSDIEALVRAEVQRRSGVIVSSDADEDILGAEWLAFITPQTESGDRDSFITRHVDLSDRVGATGAAAGVLEPLAHVVKAVRLREVRALVGFSRIRPGNQLVKPDLSRGLDFLPALVVFGEGVFIALDEVMVAEWERGPAAGRADVLAARRASSFQRDWLPEASPRFIMLHTLAHLLIRQMAFESGYSAASLTERIYCREPTADTPGYAGLLIYTAAGDQEGTLGGLVRQGDANRLAPTMLALLQRAAWCSADPICRESAGQGVSALNLAACHACALIAETSCGHSNALLDRGLVVGNPEPGVSFFRRQLEAAMDTAARAS